MLALPLALTAALVARDQTALRAAPRDSAPRQAVLWAGDWLEVRGHRLGYTQVYDHRRERAGYVRSWMVREYAVDAASAPALRAVVDFLRDSPGDEALGIGHAALLLRVAPPAEVGPEVLDALGSMADRLARRASAQREGGGATAAAALAAHLEVAESYGIHFTTLEAPDGTRLCYDGEAFRLVIALGAAPELRARAALALSNPACVDPALRPRERMEVDRSLAALLDPIDATAVPGFLGNRVRLRRAALAAGLAYAQARLGDATAAGGQAERAITELARVDKAELAEDDATLYEETAVRVAAAHWAGAPAAPPRGALDLAVAPGAGGQTCMKLASGAGERRGTLLEKCTYGLVWPASARVSPKGDALAVAVQPLPGWVELWMFHKVGAAWQVDALVPGTIDPALGYVELAGWSPDGARVVVAREVEIDGAVQRRFEVVRVADLVVEQTGRTPRFAPLRRWKLPGWEQGTLALR